MKYFIYLLIFLFACQACEKEEPPGIVPSEAVTIKIENLKESGRNLRVVIYVDPALHYDYPAEDYNEVISGFWDTFLVPINGKVLIKYMPIHNSDDISHLTGKFLINDKPYTFSMARDTIFTVTKEHDRYYKGGT